MMKLENIVIAVAIGLISFMLQIWPRLKNRYFGIDTWRFALLADYIRIHKKLPESIPEKYIVPGSVDNPPLLPLILSILPKKWLDRNQGFISPLFDLLHNLTVFFMGYVVTGNPLIGYIAQIIYAITPVVPLEASNLSLRSLSSLIFTWTMFGIQSYVILPNITRMIMAIALIVLLAYTHRMSVQVLFFSLIAFTVINNNSIYISIFFIGLAAAIFLFKGLYLKYLRGQLLLISFWMYNIKNRLAHQIRGNPTKEKKHTDFVRRIEYFIWKIPIFPLIAINPWIIYVLLSFFMKENAGIVNPWFHIMIKWSLILSAFSIIFNLKYLRFLGEGQRYSEYCTGAVSVVAATIILSLFKNSKLGLLNMAPILLGIFCIGLILFFQRKLVVNNSDKSITPELWSVIDFLNKQSGEVRIACIPHGLADAIAYFVKKGKVLLSDNSVGVWELQDFWPLIKRPLSEIAVKFGLNYFLVSTNYVKLEEIDLPGFYVVFNQSNYYILKAKK